MTLEQLLLACFGTSAFPSGDVVLQVRAGNDVLSHCDVYWRSVAVGDADVQVAAIGQVATDPAFRELGLATGLVVTAHRIARERGLGWAALFGTEPLYSRLGYVKPTAAPHEHFLVSPLIEGATWPDGEIDTRGQW